MYRSTSRRNTRVGARSPSERFSSLSPRSPFSSRPSGGSFSFRSPRPSFSSPTRRTRQDLIECAARFTLAVVGGDVNTKTVTYEQLVAYFRACNVFYCRSGDGSMAASSALKTIHGSGEILEQTTCTKDQLNDYFLETFIKDSNRVDRLEHVIEGMLKAARINSRSASPFTHPPPAPKAEPAMSIRGEASVSDDEQLQKKDLDQENNERARRIHLARTLADAEQKRRIAETKASEAKAAAERASNIRRAMNDAERERERRVAEIGKKRRMSALGENVLNQIHKGESKFTSAPPSDVSDAKVSPSVTFSPGAASAPASQASLMSPPASGSKKKPKKKKKKKKKT